MCIHIPLSLEHMEKLPKCEQNYNKFRSKTLSPERYLLVLVPNLVKRNDIISEVSIKVGVTVLNPSSSTVSLRQDTHSNCILKFPVFSLSKPQIYPVPIYVICDYHIHKTDLADLSSFWKFRQISQYP